jgi:hypothetical protein
MPFKKQRANKEQQIKPSSSGREWSKAAVDAAITALSLAKESSDWNPIVKSALSGANEIVNLCRVRAVAFAVNTLTHGLIISNFKATRKIGRI